MQINRQLFLLMLFIGLLQYLSAEEYQPLTRQEEEKKITFYAVINPWALASFLPNPINNYVNVMGIASVTWSTMPNTGVGSGWTPFPYNLNLITGIVWVFN